MVVINDIKNRARNMKGFDWAVSKTKLAMIVLGFEKKKQDFAKAGQVFEFTEEDIRKAYTEQGGLILENGKYSNHRGIPPKRKTKAETMGIMPDESQFDPETGIFVGPAASAPLEPGESLPETDDEPKINRRKRE